MTEINLVNEEDVCIYRDEDWYENAVVVRDCDGSMIFTVPKDFTDDQIMTVIKIVNQIYRQGFDTGRLEKASEIRKVIGV